MGDKVLGAFKTRQGKVLYLALEDNERRIKDRINKLTANGTMTISNNFIVSCTVAKSDNGGLPDIEQWLNANPDCVLVVVDTLARFKPTPGRNGTAYDIDTNALAPIQHLALTKCIALVLITHTRKQATSDPFERITGSTGITGVSDINWLLERARGENRGKLTVTGRDIEERELALQFDKETCKWTFLGNAFKYQISQERLKILEYLEQSDVVAGPQKIAKAIGGDADNVRALLTKMYSDGQIDKSGKGQYFAHDLKKVFDKI